MSLIKIDSKSWKRLSHLSSFALFNLYKTIQTALLHSSAYLFSWSKKRWNDSLQTVKMGWHIYNLGETLDILLFALTCSKHNIVKLLRCTSPIKLQIRSSNSTFWDLNDWTIWKCCNHSLVLQAYFITNMEPIKFWEFVSLILGGLGYDRYCNSPFQW